MKPEVKKQLLGHVALALMVVAVAVVLVVVGMNPAVAAGAAVAIFSVEISTRWRAGRCARKSS
ncbi:MAG: hypothetical protein ACR2KK_04730 [Acidimicrobiales bacterium]